MKVVPESFGCRRRRDARDRIFLDEAEDQRLDRARGQTRDQGGRRWHSLAFTQHDLECVDLERRVFADRRQPVRHEASPISWLLPMPASRIEARMVAGARYRLPHTHLSVDSSFAAMVE